MLALMTLLVLSLLRKKEQISKKISLELVEHLIGDGLRASLLLPSGMRAGDVIKMRFILKKKKKGRKKRPGVDDVHHCRRRGMMKTMKDVQDQERRACDLPSSMQSKNMGLPVVRLKM